MKKCLLTIVVGLRFVRRLRIWFWGCILHVHHLECL